MSNGGHAVFGDSDPFPPFIHFENVAPRVYRGGDGLFQIMNLVWLAAHLFLAVGRWDCLDICLPEGSGACWGSVLFQDQEKREEKSRLRAETDRGRGSSE